VCTHGGLDELLIVLAGTHGHAGLAALGTGHNASLLGDSVLESESHCSGCVLKKVK